MDFIIKFFQCLFCWKVAPDGKRKIRAANVALAQSFGIQKNWSGESNKALAKMAKKLQMSYGIPLIAQWEVASCIKDPKVGIVTQHRILGKSLDTFEVLSQMKIICKEYKWNNVVILAHPEHYWRCMMVA